MGSSNLMLATATLLAAVACGSPNLENLNLKREAAAAPLPVGASAPTAIQALFQPWRSTWESVRHQFNEMVGEASGVGGPVHHVAAGMRDFIHLLSAPDASDAQLLRQSERFEQPPVVLAPDSKLNWQVQASEWRQGARRLVQNTAALRCSGVGEMHDVVTPLPSCNGVGVTPAAYDAITTAQREGVSGGDVATLVAALAPLSANGTLVQLLGGDHPLPPALNLSTLPQFQRSTIAALTNVSDVADIQNISQLFPSSGVAGVASATAVLVAIGSGNLGLLLNDTTCSETMVTSQICICPLDYDGAACETPRHYSCAVILADTTYHACVATNGNSFQPPSADTVIRRSNGHAFAQLVHNHTLGSLGPGSGVAQPASPSALTQAHKYVGIASVREAGNVPPPFVSASPPAHVYQTNTNGIPPCLYLNNSDVVRRTQAQLVPFAFRISCAFQSSNVTSQLSLAKVLVSPTGATYWADASIEGNSTAAAVIRSTPPPVTASSASLKCNGTTLTAAYINAELARAGLSIQNATTGAPYYGLQCVESQFRYVSGGGASALFALSTPPTLPVAVRIRAISHTFLSDTSGVTTVLAPLSALDGSADVIVHLNVDALARDAAYWSGGRLHLEAQAVALPEGWSATTHTPASGRDAVSAYMTAGYGNWTPPTPAQLVELLAQTAVGASPRLVLTNIHRVVVDDSSYVLPTAPSVLPLILGLVLGLGIPIILGASGIAVWYRKRKTTSAARNREVVQDRIMAEQAETESRARDAAVLRQPLAPSGQFGRPAAVAPAQLASNFTGTGIELPRMNSHQVAISDVTAEDVLTALRD